MSLYNSLRTATSGMEAQSYKLGTIADNVANANTVGYKRAGTEFSSLILDSGPAGYQSGAVKANVHYEISRQGGLSYTLSQTDVAIEGNGFFMVQDRNGGTFLTRAGSFVVDGASGNLVNSGGFSLLGFPSVAGQDPAITLNGTAGLQPISLDYMNMRATPSTAGEFHANLPQGATVVTGDTPGDNTADATTSKMVSVVAFDEAGRERSLDVYMTKVTDYVPGVSEAQWEVVVYDSATRSGAVDSMFPYTAPNPPLDRSGATQPWLAKATLTFDPASNGIKHIASDAIPGLTPPIVPYSGPVDARDPAQHAILSIALPDSENPLQLDFTKTTQLATAEFVPQKIAINGNAPSTVEDVEIDEAGRVYANFDDGRQVEFYRLPLANVPAPDQMAPESGNVYRITPESGALRVGLPEQGGNGTLVVGAVENSNVDLATELTDMIIAQRAYTANSKTFQTANDLLDVLMTLKR